MLAIASFTHMLLWGESALVRGLWGASILCAVAAHVRRPLGSWPPSGDLLPLGLVLAGAALLRFYRLGEIPDDFHGDIASQGMEARGYLLGQVREIFRTGWSDIPGFEPWQLAATMRLAGNDLFGMSVNTALHGMLSILGTYLLARELFDRRTALIAAALLSISYTHIHFSRLFTTATPLSFMSFTFFFLARGMSGGRSLDFVRSGVLLGLGVQTYYPSRMMPIVLALLLPWTWLWSPEAWARVKAGLAWMALGFFCAFGPFLAFGLESPNQAIGRGSAVLVWSPQVLEHLKGVYGVQSLPAVLRENTKRSLLMFSSYGDNSTHFGFPHPIVDGMTALFLALGVLIAFRKIPEPRHWLLLTWLFGTVILGSVISNDPPFWPHLVVLLIPAAILAAVGMERVASLLGRWGRAGRLTSTAVMAGLILFFGVRNWRLYYDHVRNNAAPCARIGRVVAGTDPSYEVLLLPEPWSVQIREIQFMAYGRPVRDEPVDMVVAPHAPRKARARYIVTPNHAAALQALRTRYPNAVEERFEAKDGTLLFTSVRVDGTPGAERAKAPPEAPAKLRLTVTSFRSDVPELAERAIDGDPQTRWESGAPQSGHEWFQVEMPDLGTVSDLWLDTTGSGNDYARRLRVSVSADGESFEPVTTLEAKEARLHVPLDPPRTCRFIRLEQTGRDATAWWSIHELTVWAVR